MPSGVISCPLHDRAGRHDYSIFSLDRRDPTTEEAIDAGAAETGTGSVHESAGLKVKSDYVDFYNVKAEVYRKIGDAASGQEPTSVHRTLHVRFTSSSGLQDPNLGRQLWAISRSRTSQRSARQIRRRLRRSLFGPAGRLT